MRLFATIIFFSILLTAISLQAHPNEGAQEEIPGWVLAHLRNLEEDPQMLVLALRWIRTDHGIDIREILKAKLAENHQDVDFEGASDFDILPILRDFMKP